MRVIDQAGLEWEVWRQWLHAPRWRVGRPRLEDVLSTPMDDGDAVLARLAIVVVVVVITFFFFLLVGLPLLLLNGAERVLPLGDDVRVLRRSG